MEKPIIEVKNIGKKYKITHERGHYTALRDVIMTVLKKPFSFLKNKAKQITGQEKKEEFWALKNVNFTVNKGEVIGIIGHNGAGKSTLLKILSQITPPTEGEIILRGKVGSLLEVGTGFHPELTGRENIFLNGAIIGMTRKDIASKFDDIVTFAGIDKFLDTPVKYYSSGMHVRLAFSVAAHMEPDILIVDEVLAVGDAEFQKKCLGKMDEITRKDGRTVLFVSHNTEAIKKLCHQCILLSNGKIVTKGNTEEVLRVYADQQTEPLKINKGDYNKNRRGSGTLSFTSIEILDNNNKERNIFRVNETVKFKMSYATYKKMNGLHCAICFFSHKTKDVVLTDMRYEIKKGTINDNYIGVAIIEVDLTIIRPGEYTLYFWLGDKNATKQGTPEHYDVVNDLTKPLIIKSSESDEKESTGVFSLPSRIYVSN